MSAPVFVRLGLATPLGLSARATQCAVAAGLAAFRDTPVIGRTGEPLRAAWLPRLDPDATRSERILFFGERALRECLSGVPPAAFASLPVLVALPEPSRGAPLASRDVVRALGRAAPAGITLDWSPPRYPAGRAGFFQALEAAATGIAARSAEAAVILGLDSYCDRTSLEALDRSNRILGADCPDGLIPGEGAGAVLVVDGGAARRTGLAPLARIASCALGRDVEPFEQRTGTRARGLSDVLRKLRGAQGAGARVDAVFSCQTGESLWARELSIAHLRNPDIMPEPQRKLLLADSLGDVGAAAGPIQIGIMIHLHATRWRSHRALERAILYGAADGGDVGACIVAAAPPRGAA